MKLKRILSFAMVCVLLIGCIQALPARALTNTNIAKEGYTFYQRTSFGSVNHEASYVSAYADTATRNQGETNQTSWAFAAVAALEARGKTDGVPNSSFSESYMYIGLSSDNSNSYGFSRKYNASGNRNMVSAYMARGTVGGPISGLSGQTAIAIDELKNAKAKYPVSGVVYIPDLTTTAGADAKAIYQSRIKSAIKESGAVAAALYMNEDYFFEITTPASASALRSMGGEAYCYTSRATADHYVAIIGWDDNIVVRSSVTTTATDGTKTTTYTDHTGAFLVRDSLIDGGINYWVTYSTAIQNAYYIEGYINPTATSIENTTMTDVESVQGSENPFAYTYEYDTFGFSSAVGYNKSSAYFANVFTVANGAEALHAVSVFLTGENADYKIYYVPKYKTDADLKNAIANVGTSSYLVAEGSKTYPGYYTIPVTLPNGVDQLLLPAPGDKFALVCEVTLGSDTVPIPIQTGYKSTTGRSFISSDGDTWRDAYSQNQAAVCLKAHVATGLQVNVKGVSLPVTEADDIPDDFKTDEKAKAGELLVVTPGLSYSVKPIYNPANATDVIESYTEYEIYEYGNDGETLLATPTFICTKSSLSWTEFKAKHKADAKEALGDNFIESEYEEPDSIPYMDFSTKKLIIPSDLYDGRYQLKVTIYQGEQDSDGKLKSTGTGKELVYTVLASHTSVIDFVMDSVATTAITLSKSEIKLKAGGTATLSASIDPPEASRKNVTWMVASDYDSSSKTYDDANPYNRADVYGEDSPLVTVSSSGKITAIKDGTCYVYAKIVQGDEEVVSAPCKVTIEKVDPTGITVAKKKLTMSLGTSYTMTASIKPTTSSNKYVKWHSKNPSIADVDATTGIITAKGKGTATIVATNSAGTTAECVITVTEMPSATYKKGKSATLKLVGSKSTDTVKWEILTKEGNPVSDNVDTPFQNDYFTISKSGINLKVTAKEVGGVIVRAYVPFNVTDNDGNVINTVNIFEQSWNIESVIALSKLQLTDESGEIVKKVTLCVDPSGKRAPQSITLKASVAKPAGATELKYEWSSKKSEIADVKIADSGDPNNSTVTITAKTAGSTKITGVNYNGSKKVSLNVKVLTYPTESMMSARSKGPVTLTVGKNFSPGVKINGGKTVSREVKYFLTDETGAPLDSDKPAAMVTSKGKVTALGEGKVYLIARGAPFDTGAPEIKILINCVYPVTGVSLSASSLTVAKGGTIAITASTLPANATSKDLNFTLSSSAIGSMSQDSEGNWIFTAKAAGKVNLTATSVENGKRKASITITVTEPVTQN